MSKHTHDEDCELLEAAARAGGLYSLGPHESRYGHFMGLTIREDDNPGGYCWNPLDDSGQALELAVKLRMNLGLDSDDMSNAFVPGGVQGYACDHGADPLAATRRAIVRAAAAISEGEQT